VLCGLLEQAGLPFRVIAPQTEMPNIVASLDTGTAGRHLILNGHIDVFPAGDGTGWTHDPWSGDIAGGMLWGRGTADMKCGTVSLVLAYIYLHRLREHLRGKLTLTCVSDEETGGWWGTRFLLQNYPEECRGDCVLSGEPSSPHTVRYGEKGALRIVLTVRTPGSHGAYPHKSASATKIAARLIQSLEKLTELTPTPPHNIAPYLVRPDVHEALERGLGRGAAAVLPQVVVNVGVVRGGLKVNMTPGECILEVDIRLPIGLRRGDIERVLAGILADFPEVTLRTTDRHSYEPNWCDPSGELLEIIQDNAERVTGIRPVPVVTLAATDCRYWRELGIPAYVYGSSPGNMGARDEAVSTDEFLGVVRTHVLSAYDYLTRDGVRRSPN
jgi:succinyl-diaminopimelate desuccinylase